MVEVSSLGKVVEKGKKLLVGRVLFDPLELGGEVARSKQGVGKAKTEGCSTKTIGCHFAQL